MGDADAERVLTLHLSKSSPLGVTMHLRTSTYPAVPDSLQMTQVHEPRTKGSILLP